METHTKYNTKKVIKHIKSFCDSASLFYIQENAPLGVHYLKQHYKFCKNLNTHPKLCFLHHSMNVNFPIVVI